MAKIKLFQHPLYFVLRCICLTGFLTCSIFCSPLFAQAPPSGFVRVTYLKGGARTLEDLSSNSFNTLVQGAELAVPVIVSLLGEAQESLLECQFPDGSVLRFSGGAVFEVIEAVTNEQERNIRVDIAKGDCWAYVLHSGQRKASKVELLTPEASALATQARFRLRVDKHKSVSFVVYAGDISIRSRGEKDTVNKDFGGGRIVAPNPVSLEEWTRGVRAGYSFTIGVGGRYGTPQAVDVEKDSELPWVRWNMKRDVFLEEF